MYVSPKVLTCCHDLTIPQSKIKDFCQLPLHKGAVRCSRTSAFIDVSQKNLKIVPHSAFRKDMVLGQSHREQINAAPCFVFKRPAIANQCSR